MTSGTFTLRRSDDADRDAIARIWHASASLPGVGPPVMPAYAELRRRVDREFAAGWEVTLALCNGEVAGFVAIKPGEAVLDELFVAPDQLGAGLGRALLEKAMEAMPQGFTLHTRPQNERACRFYEKAGLMRLRHGVHPRSGDPIVYYGWRVGGP